ncbi:MAG: hypothetical protein VR70_17765 [Rhodospirillaceae bacterium BRH_c57]|nr:MAG: hypothetical protein VR70_17765 [Rhodospirillaceae bacterium BRH_c57]
MIDDAPAVAAQALEAAQAGARVLVLRNTVSAAIATQQALEAAAPNSRLLFRCADSPLAYPDLRVLEATWRLIEARDGWTLPAMNRELVEGATHPEVLAALATDLGDAWAGHAARMDGLRYAQQAVAALGCINTAEPYCAAGFPEGETIATRLGARDRSVAFADPPPSLFAPHIPLDTLTIPHWMAQGIPEDAQPILRAIPPAGPPTGPPGTLTSSGPTVRFALGERGYIYDRLGLRPETE